MRRADDLAVLVYGERTSMRRALPVSATRALIFAGEPARSPRRQVVSASGQVVSYDVQLASYDVQVRSAPR